MFEKIEKKISNIRNCKKGTECMIILNLLKLFIFQPVHYQININADINVDVDVDIP